MSLSSNFPTSKPSLNLDFANVGALDPRITFTRSSSATYTNSLGLIATATTNVARFDYDPVTLAARGLLVEEQRTNLHGYSVYPTGGTGWTISSATATANSVSAPDGTTTGAVLVESVASAYHVAYPLAASGTASPMTGSVFLKQGTRQYAAVQVYIDDAAKRYTVIVDLSNGTVTATTSDGSPAGTAHSVTAFSNGWYRVSVTLTSSSTGLSGVVVAVSNSATPSVYDAALPSYTGNGSGSIYFWGVQLEANASFASSYIPTPTNSTVTRSADVASVNTLSPWFNATEGTIYTESVSQANNRIAWFRDPAGGNYGDFIASFLNATFNGAGSINVSLAAQVELSTQNAVNSSTVAKIGFAYKQNDFALCMNNGTVATDTNGNVPSVNVLNIGWHTDGVYLNGHIRRLAYYPRRLTNAEIQALTS